jgi:hypothetical protein
VIFSKLTELPRERTADKCWDDQGKIVRATYPHDKIFVN